MRESAEPFVQRGLTGAGWELRFTEALLAREASSNDGRSLPEPIVEALRRIDRGRPIDEQLVRRDGETPLLEGLPALCASSLTAGPTG